MHVRACACLVYLGLGVESSVDVCKYVIWLAPNNMSELCGHAHEIEFASSACAHRCAGFNTVLGPARPTLLAACLLLNAWAWSVAWPRPWLLRQCGTASALSAAQALLPEALFAWAWARQQRGGLLRGVPPWRVGAAAEVTADEVRVALQVGNLGCAACLAAVTAAALAAHPRVVGFTVAIETGRASLTVARPTSSKSLNGESGSQGAGQGAGDNEIDAPTDAPSGATCDEEAVVVRAVLAELESRGFPSVVGPV